MKKESKVQPTASQTKIIIQSISLLRRSIIGFRDGRLRGAVSAPATEPSAGWPVFAAAPRPAPPPLVVRSGAVVFSNIVRSTRALPRRWNIVVSCGISLISSANLLIR